MMQLVVVARFERASGQAAITDRLRAITLFCSDVINRHAISLMRPSRPSPEAFPHLHLAPPARVASNLSDARALLRHWSRRVL